MTARKVNVLSCDKDGCTAEIRATDGETAEQLRDRARRENGWRVTLRLNVLHDWCRWHA